MYADTLVRKNREIQASEERYRALFDHASIAIFVTDHESGRILDANRQALALLGYRKEELLEMPALPFGGEPGAQKSAVPLYASGETTIRTKSGEAIQVDVVVGPVTRPQDPRVMLFVRDVTEKKKMQAQLLQAEKLTLMGRLAAGIAHEIRNPLAAVTLNLQYLVGKLGAEGHLRQTLDDMLEGARRIETVIGNTLNLARVAPPVLELNQLNGLIDQVLRYVKIALQQKRITIEARLDRNGDDRHRRGSAHRRHARHHQEGRRRDTRPRSGYPPRSRETDFRIVPDDKSGRDGSGTGAFEVYHGQAQRGNPHRAGSRRRHNSQACISNSGVREDRTWQKRAYL